ncbi:MAG: DUF1178 family protein [Ideonella sp.]|nr:DUF1178 family protein [Ideonella sp.]MCC7459311.1 DUF1178 family protein [Nitrospira sp.]
MKVLNLRCSNGHGFEGWFGSDDEFMAHNGGGLLQCPLCADSVITRLPSAPRLNLSGAQAPSASQPAATPAAGQADVGPQAADPQAMWLKAVRHVLAHTEDVGERFAEEARRIHYGEAPQRGIRGRVDREQREALLEEGIEVIALPLPRALDGPLQ